MIPLLLFLHISAAILAFGPSYTIPLTAGMAAHEPEHRNFVARMNLMISTRVTLPLAITMGITGGLIVIVGHIPVTLWLQVAIVLYLGLLAYSYFVQIPLSRRIIAEMSKARGPLPSPPVTPPADAPGSPPVGPTPRAPAGAPAGPPPGPPPEVAAMIRRNKLGGMGMGVVTLIIVALMVWKPTL
jgi:hypothetical protein